MSIFDWFRGSSNTEETAPPRRGGRGPDEFLLSGEWLYVGSTNVHRWRYLANDQVLEVQFLDMSIYEYTGVPFDIAKQFYLTASPGRFVWNYLRDRYPYRKVQGRTVDRPRPQVVRVLPPD